MKLFLDLLTYLHVGIYGGYTLHEQALQYSFLNCVQKGIVKYFSVVVVLLFIVMKISQNEIMAMMDYYINPRTKQFSQQKFLYRTVIELTSMYVYIGHDKTQHNFCMIMRLLFKC